MRVLLPPECDAAWVRSLTPWQLGELAELFRQGRGLPDRTNHGGDMRWCQAGCRTRDTYGIWRRRSRTDPSAHERVVIRPRSYGYDAVGIRRSTAFVVDPETGATSEAPEAWVPVWTWHIEAAQSTSWDPETRPDPFKARGRR